MLHVLVAAPPNRLRVLAAVLAADPALWPVETVSGGRAAVLAAARRRPDIVVMDAAVGDIGGHEATRRIMTTSPCPVVLTTAGHSAPETSNLALESGALAVVDLAADLEAAARQRQETRFLETVTLMAQVPVITRSRGERPDQRACARTTVRRRQVVGIAASTGGPDAVATLLRALPADLPATLLVVQHIGAGFEESLRSWLDDLTRLHVRLAVARAPLRPGEVLLAPGDVHLEVAGHGLVRLSGAAPVHGHRPSADRLFRSLAESYGAGAVGVMLTGMGHDGVEGLIALNHAGGHIVAQDEASCVVYGMPRAAVGARIVDQVLTLPEIATAIELLVRRVPSIAAPAPLSEPPPEPFPSRHPALRQIRRARLRGV